MCGHVVGEAVDASILLLSFELVIGVDKVLIQAFPTHRFRRVLMSTGLFDRALPAPLPQKMAS